MWSTQIINYLFFVLETFSVIFIIFIVILFIITMSVKRNISRKGRLEIHSLSEHYGKNQEIITKKIIDKTTFKKLHKNAQAENEAELKSNPGKYNVFVINFLGDIKVFETKSLTEEINAILAVAEKKDKVIVKLESAGGIVNGYGLTSKQLERIKSAGISLIVAMHRMATIGGYMIASVANKIIASPFAIMGSIGVVRQSPNIYRLLSSLGVDIELHAVEIHKRTLTMLGKNTQDGREKFKSELKNIHTLFKKHITIHPPLINIEKY